MISRTHCTRTVDKLPLLVYMTIAVWNCANAHGQPPPSNGPTKVQTLGDRISNAILADRADRGLKAFPRPLRTDELPSPKPVTRPNVREGAAADGPAINAYFTVRTWGNRVLQFPKSVSMITLTGDPPPDFSFSLRGDDFFFRRPFPLADEADDDWPSSRPTNALNFMLANRIHLLLPMTLSELSVEMGSRVRGLVSCRVVGDRDAFQIVVELGEMLSFTSVNLRETDTSAIRSALIAAGQDAAAADKAIDDARQRLMKRSDVQLMKERLTITDAALRAAGDIDRAAELGLLAIMRTYDPPIDENRPLVHFVSGVLDVYLIPQRHHRRGVLSYELNAYTKNGKLRWSGTVQLEDKADVRKEVMAHLRQAFSRDLNHSVDEAAASTQSN